MNNLQWVSLAAAMEHVDDWKVDWDMNLTKEEIALVMDPEWRDGLTFNKRNESCISTHIYLLGCSVVNAHAYVWLQYE